MAAADADDAYLEMRDDDAFWAARRVAAFSEELIRAAVHTGEFSDPNAEKYLADVLIKRRDKIARTYLTAVNPIVDPRAGCDRPAPRSRTPRSRPACGADPPSTGPPGFLRQCHRRDAAAGRDAERGDNHRGAARICPTAPRQLCRG